MFKYCCAVCSCLIIFSLFDCILKALTHIFWKRRLIKMPSEPSEPSAADFGHMRQSRSGPQVSELMKLISSWWLCWLIDWSDCLKLVSTCFSQSGIIWSRFFLFVIPPSTVVWSADILDDSASSQSMKTIDWPIFPLITTAVINFCSCCCSQLLPWPNPRSPLAEEQELSKQAAA